MTASRADLQDALERGRAFVHRGQLPSGELPVERNLLDRATGAIEVTLDPSVFPTMFACLAFTLDDSPTSQEIIRRAKPFLSSEMVKPGMWRYWARGGIGTWKCPADVDTTAGMLTLMRRMGWPAPDGRWMLTGNRNRRGQFFTWITPGNRRTIDPRYWWYVLIDSTPGRLMHFWRGWPHRRDKDLVSQVNVVRYLGDVPESQGAIDWILEAVAAGDEERLDKWYLDRSTLYHCMGRAVHDGIDRLRAATPVIEQRIADRATPGGEIGGCDLHTALSVAALRYFGTGESIASRGVEHLCRSQGADGGWASGPHFYGGPGGGAWWGSRVYTTAFACEALLLTLRGRHA